MKTHSHHPPQFFISLYGWTYWMPILLGGGLAVVACAVIALGAPAGSKAVPAALAGLFGLLTFACLAFYRDFNRPIPAGPDLMVAPADGKVTEVTELPHYAPFNGPALKVSIFLSVLDVHVNRSPCDGTVLWTRYEEGLFLDARHPECTDKNQSNTICLGEAGGDRGGAPGGGGGEGGRPTAVVKQIVGAIARRIIAPVTVGERLARGQRFGMIAFGSRTELYVPAAAGWTLAVAKGSHVKGGQDVLLKK
jgi:phosphatidylserine decarboxylase